MDQLALSRIVRVAIKEHSIYTTPVENLIVFREDRYILHSKVCFGVFRALLDEIKYPDGQFMSPAAVPKTIQFHQNVLRVIFV